MFQFDYIEPIRQQVDEFLFTERKQFNLYYESIEKYIAENDLILGGSLGNKILLDEKQTTDDFVYEIYSKNALYDANTIINNLDSIDLKRFPIDTLLLKSMMSGKFVIKLGNRDICIINQLHDSSYDLIFPIMKKSFLETNLYVLSPEIQLLDIYRTLYSPAYADEWENLIKEELVLFEAIKTRSKKLGADELKPKKSIQMLRTEIEYEILNTMLQQSCYMLIGDHAIDYYCEIDKTTQIIQIISSNPIETDINYVIKLIQKLSPNTIINHSTKNLFIIKDNRIKRTIFKIGEEAKEVLYIYNSGEFDLIPFNIIKQNKITENSNNKEITIQIGMPIVLLRFMLIDLWIVRLVKYLNFINEQYATKRQEAIIANIITLRSKVNINEISSNYLGVYINEIIAEKLKKTKNNIFDYFPRNYKEKNGNYRHIQKK